MAGLLSDLSSGFGIRHGVIDSQLRTVLTIRTRNNFTWSSIDSVGSESGLTRGHNVPL
jgi:hypothetical protein